MKKISKNVGMYIVLIVLVVSLVNVFLGPDSNQKSSQTNVMAYSAMLCLVTPEMGVTPLVVVAILIGLTWGFGGSSSSGRIVDSLEPEDKPIGSSLMTFVIYVGSTIGTALFASLLTTGGGSAGVPIEELTSEAFMSGMLYAMVWATVLSVVSLVTAWAVDERKRSARNGRSGA